MLSFQDVLTWSNFIKLVKAELVWNALLLSIYEDLHLRDTFSLVVQDLPKGSESQHWELFNINGVPLDDDVLLLGLNWELWLASNIESFDWVLARSDVCELIMASTVSGCLFHKICLCRDVWVACKELDFDSSQRVIILEDASRNREASSSEVRVVTEEAFFPLEVAFLAPFFEGDIFTPNDPSFIAIVAHHLHYIRISLLISWVLPKD